MTNIQVIADGASTCVIASVGEQLSDLDDLVFGIGVNQVRWNLRTASLWHKRLLTTVSVEGDVAMDPALGTPCRRRHGANRASFNEDGVHAVFGEIHADTSSQGVPELLKHTVPEIVEP